MYAFYYPCKLPSPLFHIAFRSKSGHYTNYNTVTVQG